MYEKGSPATISFFYAGLDGNPVTGASLQALIRTDYGTWRASTNAPVEQSPTIAPGFYDVRLTDSEMNCDHVAWYVRTQAGVYVAEGQFNTNMNPSLTADTVFDAIFSTPTNAIDLAKRSSYLDAVADHVLRRAMANAERSLEGDSVGSASLMGVISLLTQGQMMVANCAGDSYIYLNSAVQGNPPIGALRVVKSAAGVPIGTLPLIGPNAIPDPTQNCDCP